MKSFINDYMLLSKKALRLEISRGTPDESPAAVLLHVGTNHLEQLARCPWQLEAVVQDHARLAIDLRAAYPHAALLIGTILPRIDEWEMLNEVRCLS